MANAWTLAGLTAASIVLGFTAADARQGRGGERPSFEELDVNGDGKLTQEELDARSAARFSERDTDGNGALSREELLARAQEGAERRVDRILKRLDANEDGALSPEELAQARRGGGNRFFARVDADDDGAISKEEFEQMAQRRGERRKKKGSE